MFRRVILVSLCLFAFGGCDSKVSESNPDRVSISGPSVQERMYRKMKNDNRLADFEKHILRLQRIVNLFKKVQQPKAGEDVYTPIDFLIDMNGELRSKMPDADDKKLVRRGRLNLNRLNLPEACKVADTELSSEDIFENSEQQNEQTKVGERLTYAIRTCGTDNQFVPIAVAEWMGDTFDLRIEDRNLTNIFKEILLGDRSLGSSCRFSDGSGRVVDSVRCVNLAIKLSKSETALVTQLNYDSRDTVRMQAEAEILENHKVKARSNIKIFRDGRVELDVRPANSEG